MVMKKSITTERKNEIIKLFQQGETQANIAIKTSLLQHNEKLKKCLTSHQK